MGTGAFNMIYNNREGLLQITELSKLLMSMLCIERVTCLHICIFEDISHSYLHSYHSNYNMTEAVYPSSLNII